MKRLTTPASAALALLSVSRRHLLKGSGGALAAGFASTLGALPARLAQAQTGGGKQWVSAYIQTPGITLAISGPRAQGHL